MPFVTDEIYQKLPQVKENIMISEYPEYDKKEVFESAEQNITDLLTFVKMFRTIKAENKIGKEYFVVFQNNEDYSFLSKILKLDGHITEENLQKPYYPVTYKKYSLFLYDSKEKTLEEEEKKEKEINVLKQSIQKRENLLKNDNFCQKAPSKLVEEEKQKLALEKKRLEELL